MTTPPADPKTAHPAGQPGDREAGRVASIDEKITAVKDEILGEVRKMLSGAQSREREHLTDPAQSRGARAEQAGQNLDQMIADAIKVDRESREKDAKDAELRTKLEAATAEKPPVQRSRRHRFMGWGEPPE